MAHNVQVHAMTLFCDNTRLASASGDSTIKITSAVSGEVMELLGHKGEVTSAAAAHDSTRVVSGGENRAKRAWDSATGQKLHSKRQKLHRKGPGIRGTALCLLKGDNQILSTVFSPDSNFIKAGDAPMFGGGSVRLYDALTGQVQVKSTLSCHTSLVLGVSFAPGGSIQNILFLPLLPG